MDIFTLLLFVFIIIAVVMAYMYSMQTKRGHLQDLQDGICPKCRSSNISSKRLNSNCCGVSEFLFECNTCGFSDTFSINSSSCNITPTLEEDISNDKKGNQCNLR